MKTVSFIASITTSTVELTCQVPNRIRSLTRCNRSVDDVATNTGGNTGGNAGANAGSQSVKLEVISERSENSSNGDEEEPS